VPIEEEEEEEEEEEVLKTMIVYWQKRSVTSDILRLERNSTNKFVF
jgi:predicted type IV restriction endonuclease